jgi:hypothetical protein
MADAAAMRVVVVAVVMVMAVMVMAVMVMVAVVVMVVAVMVMAMMVAAGEGRVRCAECKRCRGGCHHRSATEHSLQYEHINSLLVGCRRCRCTLVTAGIEWVQAAVSSTGGIRHQPV